jgi:threonylcarbamoyladenosine tRNA methylthiotransferase MtaB
MKLRHFTEQHIGQSRSVLFEHQDRNGMMEGYTDNYIRVQTPYRQEWVNNLIDWQL